MIERLFRVLSNAVLLLLSEQALVNFYDIHFKTPYESWFLFFILLLYAILVHILYSD